MATCVYALVLDVPWIAIGWIVVFWRLGYASLLDPDEAHYAELTREMLHSGSWLVPLLDGKPFIDKPVLFHWLQGASVLLLGETEFAARLPTALVGHRALCDHALGGRRALRRRSRHRSAPIMFATIPATFALGEHRDLRHGVRAVPVRRRRLPAGRGASESSARIELCGYGLLTLAVMTKGPVALVLVALFVGGGVRGVERDTRAGARTALEGRASARSRSPRPVVPVDADGDSATTFVKGYLLAGNLWYFTQPIEFSARAINHTFYLRAFAGAFFPWSTVVVGRGIDASVAFARVFRSRARKRFSGSGRSSSSASSASRASSSITTSSRPPRPAA